MISGFTIIAFTHKTVELADLGYLSIEPDSMFEFGEKLKKEFILDEFFLLSTCNRVEFIGYSAHKLEKPLDARKLVQLLNPRMPSPVLERLCLQYRVFEGYEAMNHLLRVSCSLDSMVVGEKEILAQVRLGYKQWREFGFTGDVLRMVMDQVVKAAKEVYSQTKISEKPISVVSIAFRKLKSLKLSTDAQILLVGSGKTNTLFSKYLVKHGFKNFHIFNRTLEKAQILAEEIKGKAYPLTALSGFNIDFDLMVVCTHSSSPIVSPAIYSNLLSHASNPRGKKVLIDLSIPSGIDQEVIQNFPNYFIDIKSLQDLASENLDERYKELCFAEKIIEDNLGDFNALLKTRKVELAMKEVPQMIKEIKELALSTIFAKDIDRLDPPSREVLTKVLDYMEKKYISIPMVLAKDILVNS